jgi:hypothetical protein
MTGSEKGPEYYARFRQGSFSAGDQMAAASYLRIHTRPTDRVAIFGYDTPAMYLSGRANASRFVYALPLEGFRSSQATRERYRREFMNTLAERPAYIIVGLLLGGKESTLASFPEFVTYLRQGFVLEKSFGDIDLYRRI